MSETEIAPGEKVTYQTEVLKVEELTREDDKSFVQITIKGKNGNKTKPIWDFALQKVFKKHGPGSFAITYEKQDSGAFFMVGAKLVDGNVAQVAQEVLKEAESKKTLTAPTAQLRPQQDYAAKGPQQDYAAKEEAKQREIKASVLIKCTSEYMAANKYPLNKTKEVFESFRQVYDEFVAANPTPSQEVKALEESVPF